LKRSEVNVAGDTVSRRAKTAGKAQAIRPFGSRVGTMKQQKALSLHWQSGLYSQSQSARRLNCLKKTSSKNQKSEIQSVIDPIALIAR
jgi:hypothetical protein